MSTTHSLSAPPGRLTGALAARFGGLPRTFWIVFSGTIANRFGDMVVPFLVFFLGSRGISVAQTGIVVLALGAGGLVGPALGGWLSDRFSHRSALVVGLVAVPVSLGALFAAPTLPMIMCAGVLLGVTGKLYPPASAALVTGTVPAEQRPRAMSMMHWAVNIGTGAAAALAGYLAARGYWLLFVIDAVTCLAFAMLVLAAVPKPTAQIPSTTANARSGHARGTLGYGIIMRDRTMLGYVLLTVIAVTVYSMTEFAIPLSVRADGLPPTTFGMIAATNAGLVVVLQPILYGPLARLPRMRVLAGSWTLVALGVAATGLAHTPVTYLAAAAVWTVGEVGTGVVAGGIVADLAPADARGCYQGAISWAWSIARLLNLALTTGMIAVGGGTLLWWTVLVLGLGGALLVLRLGTAVTARTGRA